MAAEQQIPVFYINLASRPDRREFMEEQFVRLRILAERYSAVTKNQVPPELLALHADPSHPWPVSSGDLACGLSHQAIWRLVLERNLPSALILEDDAFLSDSIRDFLSRDILTIVGADVLKLETRRKSTLVGKSLGQIGQSSLHELQSSHMGSAAYVISRRVAEMSLNSPLVNHFGIDRFLFGKAGPHLLNTRVVQAVPSPAVQLDRFDPNTVAEGAARSDLVAPRRARVGASRRLMTFGNLFAVSIDHTGRLLRLAARDPGAIGRKRRLVPFAGDAELEIPE